MNSNRSMLIKMLIKSILSLKSPNHPQPKKTITRTKMTWIKWVNCWRNNCVWSEKKRKTHDHGLKCNLCQRPRNRARTVANVEVVLVRSILSLSWKSFIDAVMLIAPWMFLHLPLLRIVNIHITKRKWLKVCNRATMRPRPRRNSFPIKT